MDYKYTRHQVARGARADAETSSRIILIKNVSVMRATYQVRLLAFRAEKERKKLILRVPDGCKFDTSLRNLMKACKHIRRESIK